MNKEMGDQHEAFLVDLFGGRQTPGSGSQWQNPADGRQSRMHVAYAFAWDGKSTLQRSLSISQVMWEKIKYQAGGNRPMLALRFYQAERLKSILDLVTVKAQDFSEVLEAANKMARIEEQGCLTGGHAFIGSAPCPGCGLNAYEVG